MTEEQASLIIKIETILEKTATRVGEFCQMLSPGFVECSAQDSSLVLCYKTSQWQANPRGVVHGGIVASMLDNTMGLLAGVTFSAHTPTISMSVNYCRAMELGRDIFVCAHITHPGRSIIHCEAQAYYPNEKDRPIATATAVFKH